MLIFIELFIYFSFPFLALSFVKKIKDLFSQIRSDRVEKQKALDRLLDKYVTIEKKQYFIEKYSKISELIAETEKEVEKKVQKKINELQSKFHVGDLELNLIREGSLSYNAMISRLRNAEPETEEQKVKDIEDLKEAISLLESYDEELYRELPERHDIGMGMFLDKMTRRFKKIMVDYGLDKFKILPIQRLKYHAFQGVKNIKDSDVLSILNIMKKTGMVGEIIEINPQFHVILLNDSLKMDLSIPEKVLISLIYDEEDLTMEKLLEITEWKHNHAEKVIESLKNKDIIKLSDDKIKIDSFGSYSERKVWNDLIKTKLQDEKEKEEARKKHQEKYKQLLKEKLSRGGEIKSVQPEVKSSPLKVDETEQEVESKTKEKLVEMRSKEKPKVKTLPSKREIDDEKEQN